MDRLPCSACLLALSLLLLLGPPTALAADRPPGDNKATSWYRPPAEFGSVEYIIITSRKLEGAFDPLVQWKTRKGLRTDVAYVEDIFQNPLYRGTDPAESLRNFIADLYWKWGLNYVVLGGDVNLVPTRMIPYGRGTQAADLYFSALGGTWNADCDSRYGGTMDRVDHVEDVFVGRVPAETRQEVEIFLTKFFTYIKPIRRDYQKKILLLGAVLGNDFHWDADDHYKEIKEEFLRPAGFEIIELEQSATYRGTIEAEEKEVEEKDGKKTTKKTQTAYIFGKDNGRDGPCDLDHVVKFVNQGVGIVSHIIHSNVYLMGLGKGFIDARAVKRFQNPDRPFVVYTSGCQVNMFNQESISERVFFHPQGGAVAFIGCTVNSYAYQNMFERDFFEALLFHGIWRIGPALAACKARRNHRAVSPGDPITIIIRGLNLLGDPEMPVWTDTPGDLNVSHPPQVDLKASTVAVAVSGAMTGKPVRNATVCLWKEGECHATAETDQAGKAAVPISAATPGRIWITVSARNHVPYEGHLEVQAAAGGDRPLAIADSAIVDRGKGNGNLSFEAGETVELLLAFQNTTAADLTGARIKVEDAGSFLTVRGGDTTLATIKAGAFAITDKPIVLVAGSRVPEGGRATLTLAVTQGGASWKENVTLWLNAPWIVHAGHRVEDGEDGDGLITDEDAGETVPFVVEVTNLGTGSARNLAVDLKLRAAGLSVENGTQIVKELPVGARVALPPFRVKVSDDYDGELIEVVLTFADASGLSRSDEFSLYDPLDVEELLERPRAVAGVDTVRLTWRTEDEEKIAGYNVYRAAGREGPFQLLSPTPVPSSCFEDVGLDKLSFYRYRVTLVDRGLNESAPCEPVGVWTSYAQQRDWPQSAAGPVRQVVVFDADKDGILEIGASAGLGPWVWHTSGQELRHGGDYWTFGLFKNYRQFCSAPSLGDVTGDGKPDLLVTAIGRSKKVYGLTLDGKDLPGWPKTLKGESFWAPQLADLDGNGSLDVLVYCRSDGAILAWKGDGKALGANEKIGTAKGATYPPVLVDVDGNGDLEILGITNEGKLFAFHHDGGTVGGLAGSISLGRNCSTFLAVGDVDGDGKMDVVAVGENGSKIFVLKAKGGTLAGFPARMAPAGGAGAYTPVLADLDDDGKPEILVATPRGRLFAFNHAGEAVAGFPTAFRGSPGGLVVGDLNGDGAPDICVACRQGLLYAFDSSGKPFTGWPVYARVPTVCQPVLEDVDRDGDPEILLGGENSRVFIWDLPSSFDPGTAEWGRTMRGDGRVNVWYRRPQTPGGLTVTGANKPALKWTAVAGAAGYHVYRAAGTNSPGRITAQPVKAASFTDEKAGDGALYRYAVTAISTAGRESRLSGELGWEDPEPSRLLGRAKKAEAENKAASAAREYRKLLKAYPRSAHRPEALQGLGRVRSAAGLEDGSKAGERDRFCESYLALGDSWAAHGLATKAAPCYRKVLDRDPFGPWGEKARKGLGNVLGKGKD